MPIVHQTSLLALPLNVQADIISVSNQSSGMLDLLKHNKISIGTRLEITRRFDFDHSMEISIMGQPSITISEQLAANLFVAYDAAI
jgi:DtxR family Mn-dependent transcriptional regulator